MSQAFPFERRSIISLASLYAFRMLGLFMVLPVLTLYGADYRNATPWLLGVALGAYGFSQALLQIPFGIWSDRWGRKPVITLGLLIFAAGSVVAALADSVYGLVLGRFLQGGGAVAAAIMAMVADLTSEANRTKAMAGIGASIGVSFAVALILGPLIADLGGLPGVFWITTLLALAGIAILQLLVPTPPRLAQPESTAARLPLARTLRNSDLLRLDWGILVLHCVLMASFVVVPSLLEGVVGVDRGRHWLIYLPLLAGSFVAMLPLLLIAERRGRIKAVFLLAIAALGGALLGLGIWHENASALLGLLFVFFAAFNLLEASLPSLVSKIAPPQTRGMANGIYASSQFLGAFLGGVLGGSALTWSGTSAVFLLGAGLVASWWAIGCFMRVPRRLDHVVVDLGTCDRERTLAELSRLPGVAEVAYLEREGKARLKVDQRLFRPDSVTALGL